MSPGVRDVVVVGGGPAGAMAARELARRGRSVLLVERERFPRWKVCGACLGGAGREALAAVGLGHLPETLGARPLHRLRILGWERDAVLPLQGPVVVSRAALDRALLEAAREAGVEVRTGCAAILGPLVGAGSGPVTGPVTGLVTGPPAHGTLRSLTLTRDGGEEEVRARVVVAATGLAPLRRLPAAGPGPTVKMQEGSRIGVGAVLPPGAIPDSRLPAGTVLMAAAEAGYVGMVTQEDDSLDVAGALDLAWVRRWGDPGTAVVELLRRAGAPLPEGEPVEGWKGTPPLSRTVRSRGEAGVFLVGDAAGYVEPFTGEGMSWALAGAAALAPLADRAVEGWDPELLREWDRAHHRRVGREQAVCRGVAWLSRRPWLAQTALGLLQEAPGLARPLVRRTAAGPGSPG